MVASFDLGRYEPPLHCLRGRIEALVRLLDGGVDPAFVRDESATLLKKLIAYCRARIDFNALKTKVRGLTAIDVDALADALAVLANAPKDGRSPLSNAIKT